MNTALSFFLNEILPAMVVAGLLIFFYNAGKADGYLEAIVEIKKQIEKDASRLESNLQR